MKQNKHICILLNLFYDIYIYPFCKQYFLHWQRTIQKQLPFMGSTDVILRSMQFSIYLYSVHWSLRVMVALWPPPVFSHWVKPSRGQAWGPTGEKYRVWVNVFVLVGVCVQGSWAQNRQAVNQAFRGMPQGNSVPSILNPRHTCSCTHK